MQRWQKLIFIETGWLVYSVAYLFEVIHNKIFKNEQNLKNILQTILKHFKGEKDIGHLGDWVQNRNHLRFWNNSYENS